MRRYGFSKKKAQNDAHGAHTIRYYLRLGARLLWFMSEIIYKKGIFKVKDFLGKKNFK